MALNYLVFFFRLCWPALCHSILPQYVWLSQCSRLSTSFLLLVQSSKPRENQRGEEGGQYCQWVPEGVLTGHALHKAFMFQSPWRKTFVLLPPTPPLLDNPQKQICADMKADIPHSSLIIYSSCLHPPPPITHPTLTVPAAAGLTVTPISNGKVTAVFPSKSKLMIIVSNRNCAWNIYKNLFTLIKDS